MGRISYICQNIHVFFFFGENGWCSEFVPYFNHILNMHVVIAAHLVSYRSECRIDVHCALVRNITSNNYSLFYFMYLTTGHIVHL